MARLAAIGGVKIFVTSCGEVGCAGCDRTGASGKGLAQVDLQPTNANETANTRTNLTMEIRLAPSPALLKSASAAAKTAAFSERFPQ